MYRWPLFNPLTFLISCLVAKCYSMVTASLVSRVPCSKREHMTDYQLTKLSLLHYKIHFWHPWCSRTRAQGSRSVHGVQTGEVAQRWSEPLFLRFYCLFVEIWNEHSVVRPNNGFVMCCLHTNNLWHCLRTVPVNAYTGWRGCPNMGGKEWRMLCSDSRAKCP